MTLTLTSPITTVSVDRDMLHAAVTGACNAVPKRPNLPVLAAVILEHGNVWAFNYETGVQVAAPGLDVPRTAVSGRLLLDTLKTIPKKTAVTVSTDGATLTVEGGGFTFNLPALPAGDYPAFPTAAPLARQEFTMRDFLQLASVTVAAGTDDTLPTLTGVRIESDNGVITSAATDRYRLALAEIPGTLPTMLVPARVFPLVKKLAGKQPTVTVFTDPTAKWDEQVVMFHAGPVLVSTRLLVGEFPKFRSLITHEFTTVTTDVPRLALRDSVKAVATMAERNTPVRLHVNDSILLTAGVEETGAVTTVPCTRDGDTFEVAFNPAYLAAGCDFLTGDTVTIEATAPNRPHLFRGDTPGSVYLLMPVRLHG